MDIFERLSRVVLSAGLRSHGRSTEPPDEPVSALTQTLRAQFGVPRLPDDSDAVAVSMKAPKTAALVFDRIWSPPAGELDDPPPPQLTVYGATPFEVYVLVGLKFHLLSKDSDVINSDVVEAINADARALGFRGEPTHSRSAPHTGDAKMAPERSIANALRLFRGIAATPLLTSSRDARNQYQSGSRTALVTAITNLNIVDEKSLSWKQVVEFRQDRGAKADYRRLIHWLDTDMIGRSEDYIAAEIASRLERYEAALRKHGIRTVVGAIESISDARFLAAAAALLGASTIAGGATAGAATVLTATVGRAVCSAVKSLLDLDEAKIGASATS